MTNVHRVNFRRTMVKEAIGESPRRCTDIECDLAPDVDLEKIESALQFQRASTRIARAFRDPDRCIRLNQLGRFSDRAIPDSHFTGHDRTLRLLPAPK